MTTLVTIIKTDGAIRFVERDGDATAYGDRRRAIEASARKLGAEVAGLTLVPERKPVSTLERVTLTEAVAHPERLTDEQVFQVHAYLCEQYRVARMAMLSARSSRPSYAPAGQATRSERGTAAVLASAAKALGIFEAEGRGRGLWA